ncbi:MAG TPA: SBBP repeat-containing protein [bacterium]|nr:SBBP repeat-containing protein [bacterium]
MKITIILLILMIMSVSCIEDENAMNNSGWEKEWEGGGLDALALSADNTLFVGGGVPVKDAFYTLNAFNLNGEQKFEKFGESNGGRIFSLITDSDGNLYAGGVGNSQALLIKFSANGDIIWTNYLNEKESNSGTYALALDKDNNIYAADNSESSGIKGNITKFSPDGKELWHHNISTEDAEGVINALAVDSEGNVYAGGSTWGSLFGENAGETDAFLVKIAPDKTHVWEKQWGGSGDDRVYSLAVDKMNNIYVAGGTNGTNEILLKYSFDGKRLWGNEGTVVNYKALALDNENNLYVGIGYKKNLIEKYTSDGEKIWDTNDEGKWEWGVEGIALDSNGNLYVCGGSNENHLMKISASEME